MKSYQLWNFYPCVSYVTQHISRKYEQRLREWALRSDHLILKVAFGVLGVFVCYLLDKQHTKLLNIFSLLHQNLHHWVLQGLNGNVQATCLEQCQEHNKSSVIGRLLLLLYYLIYPHNKLHYCSYYQPNFTYKKNKTHKCSTLSKVLLEGVKPGFKLCSI